MKNNKKGFTLIELLVVVLILGILAAMAMPQYFKAVERSRMSEAVSLLGSIAGAQQRKYLQINKYAGTFTGLDVAPAGATGSTFHTKGSSTSGSGESATTTVGNGFLITLSSDTTYTGGNATAKREGPGDLNYKYTLTRYYASDLTQCDSSEPNGQALCADFCGRDTVSATCCSDGNVTCAAPKTGNESN